MISKFKISLNVSYLGPAENGIKENNLTFSSSSNLDGSNFKGSENKVESRPNEKGEILTVVLAGKVTPQIVS